MSVRAASFDNFMDLESVNSDASSSFEKIGVEDLKVSKFAELQATIRKLTEENEKLKEEALKNSSEQENILISINGSWQIVSSTGMEEYLQRWNPSDDIDIALFQVGSLHFHFDDVTGVLNTSENLGTLKYFIKKAKLGERKNCGNGEISFVTFLEEKNLLVTVYMQESGEEFGRVERFMKNGQLHVVTKRFAMSCTRIYEKMGTKARYSGVAGSGRVEELEEELARKDEVIDELKKEMEDQKEKNDKMIKEMKTEHLATVNRLRLRLATATITYEPFEKQILGQWELISPANVCRSAPRKIVFAMENQKLVERNDGMYERVLICGDKNGDFTHGSNCRVRAYIEDDKLCTEAHYFWGGLKRLIKKTIENDILKVTIILSTGHRDEYSYKRSNV